MRRYLALLLLAAAACSDEAEPDVAPETLAARAEATRTACLARELHARAVDELSVLEGVGAGALAGNPALRYQEVYVRFAELQAHAAAYADSAASYAATPADSVRYAERAAGFATRSPEPGTVDANVRAEYVRDFAALAADDDHPCNWE